MFWLMSLCVFVHLSVPYQNEVYFKQMLLSILKYMQMYITKCIFISQVLTSIPFGTELAHLKFIKYRREYVY